MDEGRGNKKINIKRGGEWGGSRRLLPLGMDAGASNVEIQLADWDGHSVGAEVSKSKHATDVRVRRKAMGVNQQFKQNKS